MGKLSKAQRVLAIIHDHAEAETLLKAAARRDGDSRDALVHGYAADALRLVLRESRAALAAIDGEK